MAIQNRRGTYTNFDETKMVEGEIAVVKAGQTWFNTTYVVA